MKHLLLLSSIAFAFAVKSVSAVTIEAEDAVVAPTVLQAVTPLDGDNGTYERYSGWSSIGLGSSSGDALLVSSNETVVVADAPQLQFTGLDASTVYAVVAAVVFAPLVEEAFPRDKIDPTFDFNYSYLSAADAIAGGTDFGAAEFVEFTSKTTNSGAANSELNRNRSLFQLSSVTSDGSGTINLYLGNHNAPAGFVGFDTVEITVPDPEPLISLQVDRITGAMTLTNDASATGNQAIQGYSITSANGALDTNGWLTVADNYDAGNVGPNQIDTDDDWTNLNPAGGAGTGNLSEFAFGGAGQGNDGGILEPGDALVLSTGSGGSGAAWISSNDEVDLAMELIDADGNISIVPIEYVGGTGPLSAADLNHDDTVDANDWFIYRDNRLSTSDDEFAGLSPAQTHLLGDMDGDLDNDSDDFRLFKAAYDAEAGEGAFASMLQGQATPEPASLLLIGIGALGLMVRRTVKHAVAFAPVVLLALAITQPAAATDLAWYRLGDSDTTPGPADGAVIGATVEDGAGSYPNLFFSQGNPAYSTSVVNPHLYDPLSASIINNDWSMFVDGTDPTPDVRPRLSASGQAVPSGAFTYETFVRFGADSQGVDFAYHTNNTNGGWRMELAGDNTIHLEMKTGSSTLVDINSTTAVTPGEWHHVAVIFEGNSDDGSDDAHLFFDHELQASANMSDSATGYGGSVTSFFTGSVLNNFVVGVDEIRYFDHALETDGRDFLRIPPLTAVVNTVTGDISIENNTGTPITLDEYELSSPALRLNGAWSTDSQAGLGDLDAVLGGDDAGETWEKVGNSDTESLAELFLLGESTFASGALESIGVAYQPGVEDPGLAFDYFDVSLDRMVSGIVEYITTAPNLPGDFNNDNVVDAVDYAVWRENLGGAESTLGGNGNDTGGSAGVVDAADYALWRSNYGMTAGLNTISTTTPEPTTAMLAVLLATASAITRRRRSTMHFPTMPVGAVALTCLVGFATTVDAARTVDREYLMGDYTDGTVSENAQTGGHGSPVGTSIAGSDVFDVNPAGEVAPEDYDDLLKVGDPRYHQINATDITGGHPGAVGKYGISFDGTADLLHNTHARDATDNIGMQLWVYANALALPIDGNGRQTIVFDGTNPTGNAGGPAITADGKWTLSHTIHVTDGEIGASVDVIGDMWHHVAQHTFSNNDIASPAVVLGSGNAAAPFTSVLYVNGVAVAATNDTANTAPDPARFTVGGDFDGTNGSNFFSGVMDELEVYASAPDGFDLFTDNAYIAAQIAAIPGGVLEQGDVNHDGNVDAGDVTAFVDGWLKENRLQGAHNELYVGDWRTHGWGDLNLDGRVNLSDAFLLHEALAPSGGLDFSVLNGSVATPEASALALLCMAGLFAPKQRRFV